MKKFSRITSLLISALMLITLMASCTSGALEISDPAIESALRTASGKTEGELYPADLTGITELNLSDLKINDISDLAHVVNLAKLDLSNNNISDITALGELKNLTEVNLDGNSISDISALAELENLTEVRLFDNKVKDYSAVADVDRVFVDSKYKDSVKGALSHSILADPTAVAHAAVYHYGDKAAEALSSEELVYATAMLDDIKTLTGIDSDVILISELEGYGDVKEFAADYVKKSGNGPAGSKGRIVITSDIKSTWTLTVGGEAEKLFDADAVKQLTKEMNDGASENLSPYIILNKFFTKTQLALDEYLIANSSAIKLISPKDEMLSEKLREITDKPNGLLTADDLKDVTVLDLSASYITDISELDALTSVTELNLSDNTIGDISALTNLTALMSLDLSYNAIGDISALSGLTALTNLSLAYNSDITDITPLSSLPADAKLDLTGITPKEADWDAVKHIANVIGRPEPEPDKPDDGSEVPGVAAPSTEPEKPEPPKKYTGNSPTGCPYTPEGNYHSVITSVTPKTTPIVGQVNDVADFMNAFEEGLIKSYLKTVPSKYQISFVTIYKLEGYDRYDDYRTGVFNADYRKYNGFAQKSNWAHLTYATSTGEWVLTANGELLDILKNDSEVAKNFTTDYENGLVIGTGYEKLVDLLLKWVGSI